MGEIIDMSMGGLSFRCSADKEIPQGSWALDLACPDDGFYLRRVPFTTIAELNLSKEMKRYDIQFGRLTRRLTSQLKAFIETHTAATL